MFTFGTINDPVEKLKREQKLERERIGKLRDQKKRRESDATTRAESSSMASKREEKKQSQSSIEKVVWKASLRVRVRDLAIERGIRARTSDKVQLPKSALRMVERARRSEFGFTFFYVSFVTDGDDENSSTSNTSTDDNNGVKGCYCGVLDYAADEDTCVVPSALAKRLGIIIGDGDDDGEKTTNHRLRVEFRAKELEKCEWVKLQPLENAFSKYLNDNADADIKLALEDALVQRSCVSVGDVFDVSFHRNIFQLKVISLKVEGGEEAQDASLIETDVEVDLAPSLEHDKVLEKIDRLNTADEEKLKKDFELKTLKELNERTKLKEKELFVEKQKQFREMMLTKLPIEPLVDKMSSKENVVRVRITLPNGELITRRFFKTDDVSSLFDFVFSHYSFSDTICLVTRGGLKRILYPEKKNKSMYLAGVCDGDSFFVEKI